MIDFTSRYHDVETATLTTPDGRKHRYLRRRFIPPPAQTGAFFEHVVVHGDRLDNIAARYLGVPELFWKVCDANNAMNPGQLTAVSGHRLRIKSPVGGEAP